MSLPIPEYLPFESSRPKALLVEQDPSLRTVLAEALRLYGVWSVAEAWSGEGVRTCLVDDQPAVIVWALWGDESELPDELQAVLEQYPQHGVPCVILVTGGRDQLAIDNAGVVGRIDSSSGLEGLGLGLVEILRL